MVQLNSAADGRPYLEIELSPIHWPHKVFKRLLSHAHGEEHVMS